MEVFTPDALPHAPNLRWWLSEDYTQPECNGAELIVCPHCGEAQKLEWFWSFHTSLIDCELIEERCKLYAAIERAEGHLMDLHECKVALARLLVEQCLMVHRGEYGLFPDGHREISLNVYSLPAHCSHLVQHFSTLLEILLRYILFLFLIRFVYN